jgi:HSP20 family protein
MLMRFDPFREFDRLLQGPGTAPQRTAVMLMDAYREGDHFTVEFDLPGVDASSIELTVEKNVLEVRADRRWDRGDAVEMVAAERPFGTFSRQLFLGESLDAERIDADYTNGVLRLRIPVAEQAKPRRITVGSGGGQQSIAPKVNA